MFAKLTIAGTIAAGVLLAAAPHTGSVHAQYPPPAGSCVVTTGVTAAGSGANVPLTVTVRDAAGNPVPNMPVTLVVSKQPATGASVSPGGGTTNAAGQVTGTLNVGSAPGSVEVTATPSDVSCGAAVTVGSGAVSGVVSSQVALPNTGDGASAGGNGTGTLALLMLAAGGMLAAGLGLRKQAHR